MHEEQWNIAKNVNGGLHKISHKNEGKRRRKTFCPFSPPASSLSGPLGHVRRHLIKMFFFLYLFLTLKKWTHFIFHHKSIIFPGSQRMHCPSHQRRQTFVFSFSEKIFLESASCVVCSLSRTKLKEQHRAKTSC